MILIFFVLGLIIGSFLNVCIYRIPRHKSIINPSRSFCPSCLKPIKAYDNIPVLSYILLGGKCRNCKKPISWQYPLVELVTGILFLCLYVKFDMTLLVLINIVFISLLIIAACTDLTHRIIPNVISVPGILVGLILNYQNIFNVFPLHREPVPYEHSESGGEDHGEGEHSMYPEQYLYLSSLAL